MLTVPRVLCSSEAALPAPAGTTVRTRGVGLLGCGTVGAGVARRLLASHPGLVRGIAVRHPDKPRDEDYPVTPGSGLFTETLLALLGDERPRVRIVGIGQDLFDYDEASELAKVGRELSG